MSFSVNVLFSTARQINFSKETELKIIPKGLVVLWNLKYSNFLPIFSAKHEPNNSIFES